MYSNKFRPNKHHMQSSSRLSHTSQKEETMFNNSTLKPSKLGRFPVDKEQLTSNDEQISQTQVTPKKISRREKLEYLKKRRIYYLERYDIDVLCPHLIDGEINELFTSIDLLDSHQFEHFCADLLLDNNFMNVSVTPGSGDQGVDIFATKKGKKFAIQCKHKMSFYDKLGNTAIQEVFTGIAYYKCDIGAVLTNAYFSESAKEVAKGTGIRFGTETLYS